MRCWIAHHVRVDAFEDVGGLSSKECKRLVRRCERAFSGHGKLPRGAELDKKLLLEALPKLRRHLQEMKARD